MSSGGFATATAFWSYAHSDDEDDGQIRRLKEKLDHAFKRHRGEKLASFFDRSGDHKLEWGEEWRSKIRSTIFGTTFLIAVISPSYVKSAACREEFDEFIEKAKTSNLGELLLPILWVPVEPETDDEKRIYSAAAERQWVDWSEIRKLDEASAPYKALIDAMGERLAKVAKSVASTSESPDDEQEESPSFEDAGPPSVVGADAAEVKAGDYTIPTEAAEGEPGLLELAVDAESQVTSFAANVSEGFNALQEMHTEVLQLNPLHKSASAGQRSFYFKRISKEMAPFADRFEQGIRRAVDDASDLNDTMFQIVDMLRDPNLRSAVDIENVSKVRQIPGILQQKFGNYQKVRTELSAVGRMSRDLRAPFAAIERGFDSLDEIMQLVRDWTTAMEWLEEPPPPVNPLFSSPSVQAN